MAGKHWLLTATMSICLMAVGNGCPVTPPIDDRGGIHEYGSLAEIFRHVDHYYGLLGQQKATFRTSIPSFDDLMLYCTYLEELCRQARHRYGTVGSPLPQAAVAAVQVIELIRSYAGGLESDKDQVPDLIDELGKRIDQMKRSA